MAHSNILTRTSETTKEQESNCQHQIKLSALYILRYLIPTTALWRRLLLTDEEMRFRRVKWLTQGHTARKQCCWNLNWELWHSKAHLANTVPCLLNLEERVKRQFYYFFFLGIGFFLFYFILLYNIVLVFHISKWICHRYSLKTKFPVNLVNQVSVFRKNGLEYC